MFYRKVYPKTWHLIKRNPTIWFFGMFASLLGFYEVKALFNFSDKFPDFISTNIQSWIEIFITFSTVDMRWSNFPDIVALLGVFILFAILTILAVSSQAALTYSATEKDSKDIKEPLGKQLRKGVEKFWPVFGLNIINSLIGYFFVSMILSPIIMFVSNTSDWQVYILLSIFAFFILVPLIVIISFVTRYGIAYVVIKDQKFTEAFVNSWILFRVNWLITLENAVLLVGVTFLTMIAIITSLIIVFIPLLMMARAIPFLSFMFMLIAFFLIAILLILGTSIYSAFYNVVWANVFLDLVAPGKSHSKLHRLAHKHLPRLTR